MDNGTFSKQKACNHDIRSNTTSLVRVKKMKMVHPATFDYICPLCKRIFTFIKVNDEMVEQK